MAATVVNFQTNMAALFKKLQPSVKVESLFKQAFPILDKIKKKPGFVGGAASGTNYMDVPLHYDHSVVSRTYTSADTYAYPSSSQKYSLGRTKLYGIGYLDAETIAASGSDAGAWLPAVEKEQKSVLYSLRKRTAISLYRGTGGSIGVVSVIADGDDTMDRITLTNKQDVFNFSRGMPIQMDTVDGGGTLHAGLSYVVKIDFTNGYLYVGDSTLTASDVTSDITGAAAGNFIFAHGDYGTSVNGLEAWIPLTAPSAGESYLGIDRTLGGERLYGHRLNDTALTREEIIQDLAMRCSFTGGMGADMICLMSPAQMKQFSLEMDTKVTRDPGGKGTAGFSGFMIHTASGVVEVLGDPACPENRTFLIDPSSWCYNHLKDIAHLVQDDGLTLRVVYNSDQVQFRYRSWGNLACYAPGHNAVASLPTVL